MPLFLNQGLNSMAHQHSHSHHHSHAPKAVNLQPKKDQIAFAFASCFNLLFVAIQVIFAIRANSMGLLADAAHNFGDVLGLLFSWLASWLVTKESSDRFSYGFKRTTIIASLANALILVASCAVIAYESILKFFHPGTIQASLVIIVALIGTAINASTALLFMKRSHDDLNIKAAFLHLMGDAVLSLGVAISAGIIWFTNWFWLDPIIGLILVVVILASTWNLLRDSVNLLLDAVPHFVDRRGVEDYLKNLTGVISVHDLHIWGLSTTDTALTAHLIMPNANLNDDDFRHINHELLEKFKIGHVTLQIEKGDHLDPCGQTEKC